MEDGTNYNPESYAENMLLKGMVKGLKTIQDQELIKNILEALKVLFELDEIYGMSQN